MSRKRKIGHGGKEQQQKKEPHKSKGWRETGAILCFWGYKNAKIDEAAVDAAAGKLH